MDKTRINDIVRFMQGKGYIVVKILDHISDEGGLILDIHKGTNFGKATCLVSNTEFIIHTDMNLSDTNEDLDCSEEWMNFLIKKHPEILPNMITEIDAKLDNYRAVSSERFQSLMEEYNKAYNEIFSEGMRLSNIKKKLEKALDNSSEQGFNV